MEELVVFRASAFSPNAKEMRLVLPESRATTTRDVLKGRVLTFGGSL